MKHSSINANDSSVLANSEGRLSCLRQWRRCLQSTHSKAGLEKNIKARISKLKRRLPTSDKEMRGRSILGRN
jgi:hypothetical protein